MNFDSISDIANKVTEKSNLISSVTKSINALKDTDDITASEIRDRYTNGFYNTTTSAFSPSVFSKMFDEPTYLTFRIKFDFDEKKFENAAGTYLRNDITTLDNMPEPLLNLAGRDSHAYKYYSTYDYLRNNLGEDLRANMLYRFVTALKDIQDNYPYYFTAVEGLASLSTVEPGRGIRLKEGSNVLTIKCLEGLDLKITELMQLYRKIAWDDEYQRWILPDMMRFFSMDIYVSEIRLFHTYSKTNIKGQGRPGAYTWDSNFLSYSPGKSTKLTWLDKAKNVLNSTIATSSRLLGFTDFTNAANTVGNVIGAVQTVRNNYKKSKYAYKLCDHAINNFMPTIKYSCHMCEFDISDTLSFINNLSSSKNGLNMVEPTIKIKVGKVKEEMIFPLQVNSITPTLLGYALQYSSGSTISTGQNTFISGYINDTQLMKDSTHRHPGNLGVDEIVTETMLLYDNLANKRNRINDSYGDLLYDEDYAPLSGNSAIAKESLLQGGLNEGFELFDKIFGGTGWRRSSATYRKNSTTDEKIGRRTSAYVTRYSDFITEKERNARNRKKLGGNVYTHPTTNSEQKKPYESIYDFKSETNEYGSTNNIANTTSTTSNNSPDVSKAPAKILAAQNMYNVIKSVYGEITDSASPDPAFNFTLSENVFNGVLDKISKSDATDPETIALRDIANQIINYDKTNTSTATYASDKKKQEIRDGFSYLNS